MENSNVSMRYLKVGIYSLMLIVYLALGQLALGNPKNSGANPEVFF